MPKDIRPTIAFIIAIAGFLIAFPLAYRRVFHGLPLTPDELRTLNGLRLGIGGFAVLFAAWWVMRGVRGWDALLAASLGLAGLGALAAIGLADLAAHGVALPIAFLVPIVLALIGNRRAR
jgi:hypothetical protein